MSKWITKPPENVEQNVFVTLKDGSVKFSFVMTEFDKEGKPTGMVTEYFHPVVAYKKIWNSRLFPTPQEIRTMHGDYTDGKTPKDGQRIIIVIENHNKHLDFLEGSYDAKNYEYMWGSIKQDAQGWYPFPKPYKAR